MSNILILNQSYVTCSIPDTLVYTVAAAGLYNVKADITASPGGRYSLVIKQNGSTVFTSINLARPNQSAMQFKYELNCLLNDAIEVDISDSSPSDTLPNVVKSIVSIGQGQ